MTVDRWRVVAGDLTDLERARFEPLLSSMTFQRGGPWCRHWQVINGILSRIDKRREVVIRSRIGTGR